MRHSTPFRRGAMTAAAAIALLGVASYVFILGDVKRVELAPA